MGREYKKSTRFSTYHEYEKDELDKIIERIKETGLIPSGKYVSPSQIEPYLKIVYFTVIKHRNGNGNGVVDKWKLDEHTMQFINLSQPI